jgi:Na+/proline symporter
LQFVVYMAGGLVAGWVILSGLPEGWNSFVAYGHEHGKFRFWDVRWQLDDPFTFWAAVVGGMFLTVGTHGTDQMMVQRLLCASSRQRAGLALVSSGIVVFLQFLLFLSLGVGLAAFFDTHPPSEPFTQNDRVFASFIVEQLPGGYGLIGLVLAAVFAAAMSTLSSSINSSAASTLHDLYMPLHQGEPLDQKQQLAFTRGLTVLFGLVQIGVGILARNLSSSVVQGALAIAGFSAGLLLGLFLLGVFTQQVRQRAAGIGLFVGLCVLIGIHTIPKVAPAWQVAWTWYAVIGSMATVFAGIAAHLVGLDSHPRSAETSPGTANGELS